jgi:hypothetical protein
MKLSARLVLAAWAAQVTVAAAQNQLTNGPGPATMHLTVDGWGMFGGCPANGFTSDLLWTNAQGTGPFLTSCVSAVILEDLALCSAPGRLWLGTVSSSYPQFPAQSVNPSVVVLVPNRHIRMASPQSVCGLQIQVEQLLSGPDPSTGPPFESSTLRQTYTIRNASSFPRSFNLIRLVDADLGASFSNDRAGASRALLECGSRTPHYSNGEWVFEYDPIDVPGSAFAIGAEGVDQAGLPVPTWSFEGIPSTAGHPVSPFVANPLGSLLNRIQGDTDQNLLINEGSGSDYAVAQGLRFFDVPAQATVVAHFRTRLTSMNPSGSSQIEVQARDVSCTSWQGSYSGGPNAPVLCANGEEQCANVAVGQPVTLALAPPQAGPNPGHYVVYASLGEPVSGALSGFPKAPDFSLWGPPIGPLGLAAFPAMGVLGSWTGGAANQGFALVSSLPVALLPGPPSSGQAPCGHPILFLPGLPDGISFTVQALLVDSNASGPVPVSISNAVNVSVGSAQCTKLASRCPDPLPPNCSPSCPTTLVITHESTVTGTGLGTGYGEVFRYTLQPPRDYCIDLRMIYTLTEADNGCRRRRPAQDVRYVNLTCQSFVLTQMVNNVRNPGPGDPTGTPCGCTSTTTENIYCKPKGSSGDWILIATNTLTWSRNAKGRVTASSTLLGGGGVSRSQLGPACP